MCRIAGVTLVGDRRAAGAGRRFITERLAYWGVTDALDTAVLLTSEVTANAAVHAGGQIDLRLAVSDGGIEIAVRDSSPRLPRRRQRGGAMPAVSPVPEFGEDGWPAESGRGLRIIEALADEWGVAELAAGKQVWFRLATDPLSRITVDCRCSTGYADVGEHTGIALGSGRRAVDTSAS